ncbi:DUF262 domain-containing protein [Lactobacillaceae bacterium Melli_B4]
MGFKEKVNPSVQSIADLFTENNYRIPVYQRGYSWGNDQVLDLWEDLMEVVNGEQDSHFFGQLVTFNTDDDRQELIDGQQRITTSQILLAVIKNTARQIQDGLDNNGDNKRIISNVYNIEDNATAALLDPDKSSPDEKYRLITSKSSDEEDVQDAFIHLVNNGRVIDHSHENQDNKAIKNMRNTYDKFNGWIQADLKKLQLTDRIERLERIFNSFFKKFYVVKVLAPNRQDAFTIFETLNSRGFDLTASDIIKSHIISLLSTSDRSEVNEASAKWNTVSNELGEDSNRINSFIRSYWAAKNSHVTVGKLYRKVIKTLNTPEDAKNFLSETEELVSLYDNLNHPEHKKYSDNYRINNILVILNKIKFTLYYPIVLSLRHIGASDGTILLVVRKILSLCVRYRLICDKTTNLLENAFSNVATKIWNGTISSPDAIVNEIDQSDVSDSEVNAAFTTLHKSGGLKGQKRWVLDYLLASIYDYSGDDFVSDNEMFKKVFENNGYVPIHINNEIDLQELEDYLGNWTLIDSHLHAGKDANYDMHQMVKLLNESDLKSNHQLAERIQQNDYQWNQADIERHQAELGKNVTEIWH